MLTRTIVLALPLFAASLTAQKSDEYPLEILNARCDAWTATSYGHEYDGAPAQQLAMTVQARPDGSATLFLRGGRPGAQVSLFAGFASQGWSLQGYGVEGFLLVQEPGVIGTATLDASGSLVVPFEIDAAPFGFASLFVQAISASRDDVRLSNGMRFDFNPRPADEGADGGTQIQDPTDGTDRWGPAPDPRADDVQEVEPTATLR